MPIVHRDFTLCLTNFYHRILSIVLSYVVISLKLTVGSFGWTQYIERCKKDNFVRSLLLELTRRLIFLSLKIEIFQKHYRENYYNSLLFLRHQESLTLDDGFDNLLDFNFVWLIHEELLCPLCLSGLDVHLA